MYIFPYEDIKYKSQIIIYGLGNVGYDYVLQLQKNRYADILFCVDKEAETLCGLYELNIDIYPPEKIYDKFLIYDCIIIAIENKSVCRYIKNQMLNNGILENKIIIPKINEIGVNRGSVYRLHNLRDPKKGEFVFNDFWANAYGQVDYFRNIIAAIRTINDDNKKELFDEIINTTSVIKEKILIIRIFMQSGYLNSGMLKLLIMLSNEMRNLETRYMLLSDIALLPVHFGKALYRGFYEEMQEAYIGLMTQYNFKIPKKKEKEEKKAVILISALYDINDNSKVVKHARKMYKLGYKTCIVCLDIREWYEGVSFIRPYDDCYCKYESRQFESTHKIFFGQEIDVLYIDGKTIRERIQNSINKVFEFNPSIILDMSDELAPQSYILNQFFEIEYYPWRMQCSSMFFDRLMVLSKNRAYHYSKYYNDYNLKLKEYRIDFSESLPQKKHYRADYDLKEEDYVIVTVGARLNTEMDNIFIDDICKLIQKYSSTVWLIVGIKNNCYIQRNYKELVNEKKILFCQYEEDLAGLYDICNIYVNPPRTGGGRSIRSAMQRGIPVIINDEILSDGVDFVKVEMVTNNQKEQMQKLEQYIANYKEGQVV